jgi:hypothetical protein
LCGLGVAAFDNQWVDHVIKWCDESAFTRHNLNGYAPQHWAVQSLCQFFGNKTLTSIQSYVFSRKEWRATRHAITGVTAGHLLAQFHQPQHALNTEVFKVIEQTLDVPGKTM